jgi:hypothetical protein
MSQHNITAAMATFSETPCRTAMSNLAVLLKSYNESNAMAIESIFDNAFDERIRMDLNGRSYKRDFLLYQETKNSERQRQVYDIVMEVLDSENFHFTYRLEDCCDCDENDTHDESSCSLSSIANLSSTFHSVATVKNGKVVRIKPMTASAYIHLFESNITYAMDQVAKEEYQSQQEGWGDKETASARKERKSRRRCGPRCLVRRLSGMFASSEDHPRQ